MFSTADPAIFPTTCAVFPPLRSFAVPEATLLPMPKGVPEKKLRMLSRNIIIPRQKMAGRKPRILPGILFVAVFAAGARAEDPAVTPSTALESYLHNGDLTYGWEVRETVRDGNATVYTC